MAKARARPSETDAFSGSRVIRKYPNRRLYDTQGSCYVSLGAVKDMVLQMQAFVVVDSTSGEDITRSVLVQILLDQESAGAPVFTQGALANLIRLYGSANRDLLGEWMERSTMAFGDWQTQMNAAASAGPAAVFPFDLPKSVDLVTPWVNQTRELAAGLQSGWTEHLSNVMGVIATGKPPSANTKKPLRPAP